MSTPTDRTAGAHRTARERGAVSPILIVAGIAIVAFAVALVAFSGGDSKSPQSVATGGQADSTAAQGSGCAEGKPDSSYTVAMDSDPNPPRAEGTTFHFTVKRDGKPVAGAKVCMTADMTEMRHEGINNTAKEAAGGKYDTNLKFGMRGPYAGSVTIVEPGKAAVSVPVTFQVT